MYNLFHAAECPFISFDSIKEGSPSAAADLQGAKWETWMYYFFKVFSRSQPAHQSLTYCILIDLYNPSQLFVFQALAANGADMNAKDARGIDSEVV